MQDCQGVSTWKAKWLENHPAPCFEIHSVLTCLQKVEMQLAPHDWDEKWFVKGIASIRR